MENLKLITKTISKKDGTTFPKVLAIYNDGEVDNFLEVGFYKECKDELDAKMTLGKLKYPVEIAVDPEQGDYFLTTEEYTDKNGNQAVADKIVFRSIREIKAVEKQTVEHENVTLSSKFGKKLFN